MKRKNNIVSECERRTNNRVDLKLLIKQKIWVLRQAPKTYQDGLFLEGVLGLLDYIQDGLEDTGTVTLERIPRKLPATENGFIQKGD